MGPQAWIELGAQVGQALVWLGLTLWCLERLRAHRWARLGAVGAVLLLVPAVTLSAARAQLLLGGDDTILFNYVTGSLPTVYAVLSTLGAALLLAAVVVGRSPIRSLRDTPRT